VGNRGDEIEMKTTRCDVCKKCQPDVIIPFRRRYNWWQYFYDSQGGCWEKIDICEDCWESWEKFVESKKESK